MDDNNEYYFASGTDHPLAAFVQQVSAPDEGAARRGMRHFYADRCWAFCCRAEDVFPMVEGDRVVLPMRAALKRLPNKIVVDGGEIRTEPVSAGPEGRTS